MIIAIDFDGTIVEHRYPNIGREIPFATATLKKLIEERHRLILWTVREGELLDEAINFCKERGVEFYSINSNFPEEEQPENGTSCRKLDADLFIDDRNVGGIPDWGVIYELIQQRCSYDQYYKQTYHHIEPKKEGFWSRLKRGGK